MIVLDTNVLSEIMKPKPATTVIDWMAASRGDLYTTSITQAEILHGLMLLPRPTSERARSAATSMFEEDFAGRILGFGSDAASTYARIASDRRRAGRPISHFDAQIAAIARVTRAAIATRNTTDFDGCGVTVVDPWKS